MIQKLAKKLYGRFNGKLFPIAAIPMSWITVLFFLVYKKKKQRYFLLGSALGDVVYALSFLTSIKNKYGDTYELILVSSNKYKDIVSSYSVKLDKEIYIPHLGLLHLFSMALGFTLKNSRALKLACKIGVYPAIPIACSWLFRPGSVGTRNKMSQVYNVPILPIDYHNMSKVEVTSIPEFVMNKDRICVLNPYSYSMSSSIELFEALCGKLIEKGFVVYTNVVGDQKPISGSNRLFCSIQELYSIASSIPLVVSLRSGILDFLVPSGVNMVVVYVKYDDEDHRIADDFSLSEWKSMGKIEELYFDRNSNKEELVESFQLYLESLNRGGDK